MGTKHGYYDIEVAFEDAMIENGMIDGLFYLRDLKQRKLFLNEDVSSFSVAEIVKHIMQFNAEDRLTPIEERTPILLYVTSNGGEVDAGFELIDVIQSSKTPVYTINLGYQYSMGFLIGLAGHKRFAMPTAKYLMHDGSNFVFNSGAKAQDQMKFQQRVEGRIKQYVLSQALVNCNVNPHTAINDESLVNQKNGTGYITCITDTFLRGTNLDDAVIIIDEAQNYTVSQLKKTLTRVGKKAKVIVIGHELQCDLERPAESGFMKYIEHFKDKDRATVCNLTTNHRSWISQCADEVKE